MSPTKMMHIRYASESNKDIFSPNYFNVIKCPHMSVCTNECTIHATNRIRPVCRRSNFHASNIRLFDHAIGIFIFYEAFFH